MRRLLSLPAILLCALLVGVAFPAGTASAQTASPTRVVRVPSSIDATGTKDVSDAFASFLASVPDNTTIELASRGRYRMEKTLLITGRHHLSFQGNGATVFATTTGDRARSNFKVIGGSNIHFRNLTVRGAHPNAGEAGDFVLALEAQHAFDALGVVGFVVENVVATDVYGDFVHLGRLKDQWAENIIIRNNHFERNGRQGITFFAAKHAVVENNTMTDMRRATFDFEPGGDLYGAIDITIRNNRIGRGRLNFVSAGGRGQLDDITIQGNTLTGQSMQVFLIDKDGGRRRNWKIIDNTSDTTINNPHKALMRIWRVDNLEIRGNRQRFTPGAGMYGASIDSSCGLAVDGNDWINAIGQANLTGSAACPVTATVK